MGYRVVALSSGPSKEEISLQLGAFKYLDGSKVNQAEELKKLGGAKVLMLCAPTPDVAPLLDGVAYDGTVLVLAAAAEPSPIPLCEYISSNIHSSTKADHATQSVLSSPSVLPFGVGPPDQLKTWRIVCTSPITLVSSRSSRRILLPNLPRRMLLGPRPSIAL